MTTRITIKHEGTDPHDVLIEVINTANIAINEIRLRENDTVSVLLFDSPSITIKEVVKAAIE
jgi:hypothetical protein